MLGWLGITMATGGLYVFTMGLTMLYKSYVFYCYSMITTGKIVETEYMDLGHRRSGYAAVIEFELKDKKRKIQRKIRFTANELKGEESHEIGAEVAVRFIPQKPEIAKINSFTEIWTESISGIIVGGAFTLVGLFFLS